MSIVCDQSIAEGGTFSPSHPCGERLTSKQAYLRHLTQAHGIELNEARRLAGFTYRTPTPAVFFACELGAMCPKLRDQLKHVEAPRKPGASEVAKLQGHADAISRLHVHQMITDAEAHNARKRLMRKIHQACGLS
jgi:hypothetical protein